MTLLHTSAVQKDVVPRFIVNNSKYLTSSIDSSVDIIAFLLDLLDERKAFDIVHYNALARCGYIVNDVICATHTSFKAIHALAKYIKIVVKQYSVFSVVVDASDTQGWVVLDIGANIFVHLFLSPDRQKYEIDDFYRNFTAVKG